MYRELAKQDMAVEEFCSPNFHFYFLDLIFIFWIIAITTHGVARQLANNPDLLEQTSKDLENTHHFFRLPTFQTATTVPC